METQMKIVIYLKIATIMKMKSLMATDKTNTWNVTKILRNL